jgi:hypothetical protein
MAFDERVAVFKLAQGGGVLGHGWHPEERARTFGRRPGPGRVAGDSDPPDLAVFLGAPLSFCLRV